MDNALMADAPMPDLYRVKVVYSYTADSQDEVDIFEGDTVRVLQVG